jgi:hypothetical protein
VAIEPSSRYDRGSESPRSGREGKKREHAHVAVQPPQPHPPPPEEAEKQYKRATKTRSAAAARGASEDQDVGDVSPRSTSSGVTGARSPATATRSLPHGRSSGSGTGSSPRQYAGSGASAVSLGLTRTFRSQSGETVIKFAFRSTEEFDSLLESGFSVCDVNDFDDAAEGVPAGAAVHISMETYYWDDGLGVLLDSHEHLEIVLDRAGAHDLPDKLCMGLLGLTRGCTATIVVAPPKKPDRVSLDSHGNITAPPSHKTCHMLYIVKVLDWQLPIKY